MTDDENLDKPVYPCRCDMGDACTRECDVQIDLERLAELKEMYPDD